MKTLCAKLHPSRFTSMSPKMSAIVGCILGQKWTEPSLIAMMETSDGFVLAQGEGDFGFNDFIGSMEDMRRNWDALLDAAMLSKAEKKAADKAFQTAFGIR